MAASAAAAIRDEKRALLDRLVAQRDAIAALAELLSEIEEKFKVPIQFFRSSAVVGYHTVATGKAGKHRRYVEFRVWTHTEHRLAEEIGVEGLHGLLDEWLGKLIGVSYTGPPIREKLAEYIAYEEDEPIDADEVRPDDAKIGLFYGFTWYSPAAKKVGEKLERTGYPYWYLYEQEGEEFKLIDKGVDEDFIKEVQGWFRVEGRMMMLKTVSREPVGGLGP